MEGLLSKVPSRFFVFLYLNLNLSLAGKSLFIITSRKSANLCPKPLLRKCIYEAGKNVLLVSNFKSKIFVCFSMHSLNFHPSFRTHLVTAKTIIKLSFI